MQEGHGTETGDFGPTPLEELTQQESSLWALLKVLLSALPALPAMLPMPLPMLLPMLPKPLPMPLIK